MRIFPELLEPYEPIDTPRRLDDKKEMELTDAQQSQLREGRKKFGNCITSRPIWRSTQNTGTFSTTQLMEEPELDRKFFAYVQLVLRAEILRYVKEYNCRIQAAQKTRVSLLSVPKEIQFEQFCRGVEYVVLGQANSVFKDAEHIRTVIAQFVDMVQEEFLASNAYYQNTQGRLTVQQIETQPTDYEHFTVLSSCDIGIATSLDSWEELFERLRRIWELPRQKRSREERLALRVEKIRLLVCLRIREIYEEALSQEFVTIVGENGEKRKELMPCNLHLPRTWQVERLLAEYNVANRLRRYEEIRFDKREIAYFIQAASEEIEDILNMIN